MSTGMHVHVYLYVSCPCSVSLTLYLLYRDVIEMSCIWDALPFALPHMHMLVICKKGAFPFV